MQNLGHASEVHVGSVQVARMGRSCSCVDGLRLRGGKQTWLVEQVWVVGQQNVNEDRGVSGLLRLGSEQGVWKGAGSPLGW